MQIWYGSYSILPNSAFWARGETLLEENGVPYAKEAWARIEGYLNGTGQADLSLQSAQLTDAFRQFGNDLTLRNDSGQILESLTNASAIIPVRCNDGPNFIGRSPNEYGGYRQYTAGFRAVYPVVLSGVVCTEYTSALTSSGGFPTIVFLPDVNGEAAQRQQTTGPMPYEATQEGYALARGGWYAAPGPVFPAESLSANPIIKRTIERSRTGPRYRTEWAYRYQATTPFIQYLPQLLEA